MILRCWRSGAPPPTTLPSSRRSAIRLTPLPSVVIYLMLLLCVVKTSEYIYLVRGYVVIRLKYATMPSEEKHLSSSFLCARASGVQIVSNGFFVVVLGAGGKWECVCGHKTRYGFVPLD